MKNKAVIFGVGNFALMLKTYLEDDGICVSAFTVDSKYISSDTLDGVPVVPFEYVTDTYSPLYFDFYVAVGYRKMGEIREKALLRAWGYGYDTPNYCHHSVIFSCDVDLGKANIVLPGVIFGYKSKIGNGNLFFEGATIAHNAVVGDYNSFSINSTVCGTSKIDSHCFFGAGCVVRNRVYVASYTLVGAGAYLSHDSKNGEVFAAQESVLLKKSSMEIKEIL